MSERDDVKRRTFSPLCDFCQAHKITVRVSVPVGTNLNLVPPEPGGELILSDGNMGMCDGCRAIWETGVDAARALASRMLDLNPRLSMGVPKEVRDLRRRVLRRFNERILPLLSNPRPAVLGEAPMDLKGVYWDGDKPPPPDAQRILDGEEP